MPKATTEQVAASLHAHEVQCEERWKTIFARIEGVENTLQRVESRNIAASGIIIMFLLGLIAAQVM